MRGWRSSLVLGYSLVTTVLHRHCHWVTDPHGVVQRSKCACAKRIFAFLTDYSTFENSALLFKILSVNNQLRPSGLEHSLVEGLLLEGLLVEGLLVEGLLLEGLLVEGLLLEGLLLEGLLVEGLLHGTLVACICASALPTLLHTLNYVHMYNGHFTHTCTCTHTPPLADLLTPEFVTSPSCTQHTHTWAHMSTTPSPLLHLCTCVCILYISPLPPPPSLHPPPHTLTYQVVVKFLRKASVLKDCWVQDKEMGEVPLEISLLARLAHPNIVQVTYLLPVGQDWINILVQLEPL